MTQLAPDLLLALEAGKKSRIRLQTQVRRLDGDDLIFLFLIPGLVNGGHPAAAHRFDDGEPPIQQIAGMQLRAEVRFDRVVVFGHVLEQLMPATAYGLSAVMLLSVQRFMDGCIE